MKFYFTFCGQHEHKNGYVEIEASNAVKARKVMFDKYGEDWAFHYEEEEFKPQIKQFNLYKVESLKGE